MRPRIVDWLAGLVGPDWAEWLVPAPSAFYALAMIAMLIVFVRRSRHLGESSGEAAATAFWAMLAGLVGARVFYWIQHGLVTDISTWKYALTAGGTASWGVYLGTAAGLLAYRRLRGAPALPALDIGASVAGLGIAIGRLSCFLNGDDYGTASTLPWSVQFPPGSYPFTAQVREGMIDPTAPLSLAVHPVQLYLALNGLLLFWITSVVWRRFRGQPGITLVMYLGLYSVMRFGLEFFRGDQDRYFALQLSVPQIMSLATLWVSAVVLVGWRLGWLWHGSPHQSTTVQAT